MKRMIFVLSTAAALSFLPMGCKTPSSNTPPAALAPGFSSQADQTMDQVLVGAHNFYLNIQTQIAAGKYTPAPTEKTALNTFASAVNTAETVYLAYHNGTATQAAAQAAVDSVAAQQTALQSALTTGAK